MSEPVKLIKKGKELIHVIQPGERIIRIDDKGGRALRTLEGKELKWGKFVDPIRAAQWLRDGIATEPSSKKAAKKKAVKHDG